uniref:NADH-ubiquinone oxidoreductase chain 6 n=1 Tax=[Candida] alai TaxID=434040 RepID=E3VW11_9ASCO|nr:NADH dehydrogenase subunit 6 [[Candida] alai]ADO51034.1 NADH dehydrogenase subunit 6 [[Candida] alai]
MSIISGIASLLAIGILSPIQSILCLIIIFTSTAIYLYINGFILMGILYILIYVGAIAILFLFIVSLLNIEYTKLIEGNVPLILSILIIILIPLDLTSNINIIENIDYNNIYNELNTVGSLLYTDYAFILIILSIILVLSVIGAIIITR